MDLTLHGIFFLRKKFDVLAVMPRRPCGRRRDARDRALDGFRNLSGFEFSACGDEAPVIGALAHAYATIS